MSPYEETVYEKAAARLFQLPFVVSSLFMGAHRQKVSVLRVQPSLGFPELGLLKIVQPSSFGND
jgi:hypothetical protein